MEIVNLPASFPRLFWTFAVLWSVFQGYAGFYYGLYIYDSANLKIKQKYVRVTAYGLHHGAFYFICSLSGFTAWCLIDGLLHKVDNLSQIGGGAGTILVAFSLLTVAGVSGVLPRILHMGNRPV